MKYLDRINLINSLSSSTCCFVVSLLLALVLAVHSVTPLSQANGC